MSAYFQMGHDSENLVSSPGLDYGGIILSPVNRSAAELQVHVRSFREKGSFDIVLDPQLYCPRHQRGSLPNHTYFPNDLETADLSNPAWWHERVDLLVKEATAIGANGVCSPAVLPNKYDDGYYEQSTTTFLHLADKVGGSGLRPILTLFVSLKSLATPEDALRIASIATSSAPGWCYLVIEAEITPRREIADEAPLLAVLTLVHALETHGCRTIVSHTSSDMILFKAVGASHCATGKFFNLRRFVRGRFEEEGDGGGRNVSYWFEQGLLTFLREADLAALKQRGFERFIGVGFSTNQYSDKIREQMEKEPGKAWLALGWRQYLLWFCLAEKSLSGPSAMNEVKKMIRFADSAWGELEEADLIFDERQNNGEWVRRWRRLMGSYKAP